MAKKILIIDDNQDILDVVQETLAYENFEVFAKSEADNALEVIREFKPNLVILDYRLGAVTGGDICKQVKAIPEFSDLPIIIFSAYINNSDELYAYGCDAIIDKPFNLVELIDKVNNLVYPTTA